MRAYRHEYGCFDCAVRGGDAASARPCRRIFLHQVECQHGYRCSPAFVAADNVSWSRDKSFHIGWTP